MIMEQNI